jgi:hypothetical protein
VTGRLIGRIGSQSRRLGAPGLDLAVTLDTRDDAPIVRFAVDVCGREIRFFLTASRARSLRDVLDRALVAIERAAGPMSEDEGSGVVVSEMAREPQRITRVRAGDTIHVDVGVAYTASGVPRVTLDGENGRGEPVNLRLTPGPACVLASALERAVAEIERQCEADGIERPRTTDRRRP